MKIVQFEKSVRIHLSPGEFEALKSLVDLGTQWILAEDDVVEDICACSSPAHNLALRKWDENGDLINVDSLLMKVTEDRRK